MPKEIIMKLTILPICIISVMLAATIIISAEIFMSPFEAADTIYFSGQTTGGGRIWSW